MTQLVDTLSKAAFLFSFFMICDSNSLYEKNRVKRKYKYKFKNGFTPWCTGSDCSLTKHSINERTMVVARRCLTIIYIMYLVRVSCFFGLIYLFIRSELGLHGYIILTTTFFFQPVKPMTIRFQWSLTVYQTCLCRLQ